MLLGRDRSSGSVRKGRKFPAWSGRGSQIMFTSCSCLTWSRDTPFPACLRRGAPGRSGFYFEKRQTTHQGVGLVILLLPWRKTAKEIIQLKLSAQGEVRHLVLLSYLHWHNVPEGSNSSDYSSVFRRVRLQLSPYCFRFNLRLLNKIFDLWSLVPARVCFLKNNWQKQNKNKKTKHTHTNHWHERQKNNPIIKKPWYPRAEIIL